MDFDQDGQFELVLDEYITIDDQGQYPVYQGDPTKVSAQQAVMQDTTFHRFSHCIPQSTVETNTASCNLPTQFKLKFIENIGGIDSITVDFADGARVS